MKLDDLLFWRQPAPSSSPLITSPSSRRQRPHDSVYEKGEFRRRIGLLIVGGAILIVLAEVFGETELRSILVRASAVHTVHVILGILGGIGEASMIAGLLAFTVDVYLKRRLTEEITEDVSSYVMSRGLPRELQDEVDHFCRQHSVRVDLELNYTFAEIEGRDDFILMTVLLHFQVVNLTDEFQPFKHVASVQLTPGRTTNAQESMVVIPEAGAKYVFDESGTRSDYLLRGNLGADTPDGAYRNWSADVWIPPKGTRPNSFFWSYRRQVLPIEFQDTFIMTSAAIRPRLEVRCPEWMDVTASFGHRIQPDEFVTSNPKFWVLNAGLPPFANISIEWRKRGKSTPVVPVEPEILGAPAPSSIGDNKPC
jgi:hypothetical protein